MQFLIMLKKLELHVTHSFIHPLPTPPPQKTETVLDVIVKKLMMKMNKITPQYYTTYFFQTYTQTKKTVNTENISGMSIVFCPITCETL